MKVVRHLGEYITTDVPLPSGVIAPLGTFQFDRLHQLDNARMLQKAVDTYAAAEYLHMLGWSIEAAMWILCQKEVSDEAVQHH